MKAKQVIAVIVAGVFLIPVLAVVSATSGVYAAEAQDLAKGNKQNFAGGDFTGIPNLFIEKIECGPGNKLSVTIKQEDDSGQAVPGSWKAVGEVYFDDNKMGVFDLSNPTTTEGGGIDYYAGSSTYLLPWEITTPVTVMVTIIATNTGPFIPIEGDWDEISKYTYQQARLEPLSNTVPDTSKTEQVEPPINTTRGAIHFPPYLPLLLGLIGLSIVVWAGYQRYGSRMFHITHLFHRTARRP